MPIKIVRKTDKSATADKKKCGHTKSKAPNISLNQPGRLRVANLMALLGVSHSTLYAGISTGRYPPPSGRDGKMPFWSTEIIRQYLEGGEQ